MAICGTTWQEGFRIFSQFNTLWEVPSDAATFIAVAKDLQGYPDICILGNIWKIESSRWLHIADSAPSDAIIPQQVLQYHRFLIAQEVTGNCCSPPLINCLCIFYIIAERFSKEMINFLLTFWRNPNEKKELFLFCNWDDEHADYRCNNRNNGGKRGFCSCR